MPIDLRSDTVTQPTDAMREAMARAEVGDDVYGEDPTINRLQELAAERTGKEAALFMPTGSMANLIAVKAHTEPGQEVVIQRHAHIVSFEMGGIAWFSSVMPRVLDGERGLLHADEVAANIHKNVPYYRAQTGLVCVENTHNYAGGTVYPLDRLRGIWEVAREQGVPVHMDGARVFNASVALGVPVREICQYTDSVMFSFSKGLSAPIGSILCGSGEFIQQALRIRRVVGGGMRQAGHLAAACILALQTMVERLAEDHAHAKLLARGLAEIPGFEVDAAAVETNIVMCRMAGGKEQCQAVVVAAREQGVLVSQLTPDTIRLVTHRNVSRADVERAVEVIRTSSERLSSP